MDVGSAVATPAAGATPAQAARCAFPSATALPWLEGLIDTLDAALPPLMQFILPSGGPAAAQLHVARAVCRRAERAVVPLLRSVEDGGTGLDPSVAAFLNRASDYLFAAARTAAAAAGRPEETYKKAG